MKVSCSSPTRLPPTGPCLCMNAGSDSSVAPPISMPRLSHPSLPPAAPHRHERIPILCWFAVDGAIDGVDQHLGLDEFEPRPLGLVAVEWRGERLGEGV